jgi:predicted GIY-YIG superfamily endonuclease
MNNFFVYMLKCSDGSYYVGRTHNIEQRLAEHRNKQGGLYTALRLPVMLVFQQEFASENDAYAMEQKLKGWSRKKKEALIKGDWKEIVRLSNQ